MRDVVSNAGRCDVCGSPISMADGDRLAEWNFRGEPDGYVEAIAEAMERVADGGADLDLAETLREDRLIVGHSECLDESALGHLADVTADPP